MRRYSLKDNLISALIGIMIGLPLALYATDEQEKTREAQAEIRREIYEEQHVYQVEVPVIELKAEEITPEPTEEPAPLFIISEEEFEMMAQIVCAETYADDQDGKRYVADVILNRVDDPRFPGTITEVILQDGQFSTAKRLGTIEPTLLDYGAVITELNERSNSEIIFFTCTGYLGTPCFECGGNYFGK